jgi:hypothetical protein
MPPTPPFPKDCTDRFTIVEPLASGGYGTIFLARQRALDRLVVVKLLTSAQVGDPDSRERFTREARLTAALTHPHIVVVHDHGCQDRIPWIAYEYLEGPSLRQTVEKGPMRWREAAEAIGQVALGLQAAHAVVDLGVAKWCSSSTVQTAAGTIFGSPNYLAPEVIKGEAATQASDLYALGITLHELLTGVPPFAGSDIVSTLRLHLEQDPPSLVGVTPRVPVGIAALVDRLLAKDPADRPGSAAELATTLEELRLADSGFIRPGPTKVFVSRPSLRPPTGAFEPARPPTRRRAAGIVVALGLVVAMLIHQKTGQPGGPPVTGSPARTQPTRSLVSQGVAASIRTIWLRSARRCAAVMMGDFLDYSVSKLEDLSKVQDKDWKYLKHIADKIQPIPVSEIEPSERWLPTLVYNQLYFDQLALVAQRGRDFDKKGVESESYESQIIERHERAQEIAMREFYLLRRAIEGNMEALKAECAAPRKEVMCLILCSMHFLARSETYFPRKPELIRAHAQLRSWTTHELDEITQSRAPGSEWARLANLAYSIGNSTKSRPAQAIQEQMVKTTLMQLSIAKTLTPSDKVLVQGAVVTGAPETVFMLVDRILSRP